MVRRGAVLPLVTPLAARVCPRIQARGLQGGCQAASLPGAVMKRPWICAPGPCAWSLSLLGAGQPRGQDGYCRPGGLSHSFGCCFFPLQLKQLHSFLQGWSWPLLASSS